MQLNVRGILKNHVLQCSEEETIHQLKEKVSSLEKIPSELLALYSCGVPLVDDQSVSNIENYSIDVTVPLLGGKVHGSLARAGKVKGQTPKVEKQEKKKKKTGRAKRRCQYNKRFVNTVQTFGRRKGPNANS